MARKPAAKLAGAKSAAARQEETPAAPHHIVASLSRMEDSIIEGWAFDAAAPLAPLRLRILIDDTIADVITCDLRRQDTGVLNLPSELVGFRYSIPPRFIDGGRHVLKFATVDGVPVTMASRVGMAMPELHFCIASQSYVEGVLDGVVDGLVQGWALKVDSRTQAKTGGLRILVTEAGHPVAELLADQFRGDVADALGADAACGFFYAPTADERLGRRATLHFYVMPGRFELRGSPLEVRFPDDTDRKRINALLERAEELFGYAYNLRKELRAALPADRYMIADYPRWAAKSAPLALARTKARYGAVLGMDMVSIVCPVYRPVLAEFLAMVDSVRGQSYPHWELLLVDDGSGDDTLTAAIRRLMEADPRIRSTAASENGGIARATNLGIQMAAGRFIAFIDQDDALAPQSLEIMLLAQAGTGAGLLYSDEDKIDRSGALSEPHFKPDFNYRFLLEVNYICHFVMVEAAAARRAGLLDPRLDGAQDHDFLLRLTEQLTPAEIHHVPEILYHWRKSVTSTASAVRAKPTAAGAGEAAVTAHLQRRNLAADVTRRGTLTCYRVNWKPTPAIAKAARVSILIPFRDRVELTGACVAAIRRHTRDVEFEIILLDNWSNTSEAESFCAAQGNLPDTSVIRIAEPFNYSRINNIGAARARHDFLLLMNNDVFVHDPDWLRIMLAEMLIDERVGAVGPKLIYPNKTVQHAGVVLGVGGIADHAFRGIGVSAPGYMMHAMAAQQVSAVTGACMLVRKSAYLAVGGLDEAELPVAFNDIDLCLKLTAAGWTIMFTPDAVAEHRESASRGDDFQAGHVSRFMLDNEVMRRRYADTLPYDPFYNRHFSREGGVYRELRLLGPEDR
jgi:GT2 family glycosyltransferase